MFERKQAKIGLDFPYETEIKTTKPSHQNVFNPTKKTQECQVWGSHTRSCKSHCKSTLQLINQRLNLKWA